MIIQSSFYLIILFGYFSGTLGFKCMHKTTSNTYDDHVESNDVNVIPFSQQTQYCNGYCYSYWKYDPNDLFNTSLYRLITSGCSDDVVDTDQFIINCNIIDDEYKQQQQPQQCISSLKFLDISNNTSFCCCYGDLCNIDYQIKFLDEILDSNDDALKEDYKNYTIFLIFVCFIFFTFSIISAKLLKSITTDKMLSKNNHYLNHHQKRKTTDSLHLLESQSNVVTSKDTNNHHHLNFSSQKYLNDLIFIEIISHGKYGPIWKGKLNDTTVAIKVCSDSKQKHLWTNEYSIYSLPLMNHPNLPNFYRNIDRSLVNDHIENCLVIEYGHYGSLQSYLSEHTFNWSSMCQLFKSLIQGLSYLHTEIHEDGKFKPSIAHCSLNSSNIVVKADGTCMICDFKYAVNLTNYGATDRHTVAERSTNVRYLAPEILDESINYYYYTESALKQADVYSLGLILWEIASRCRDLYQGIDVPGYKLPYEQEIGLQPSTDQMKLLVNRHKARPLFPDIWKDSNYAIRLLKETINECWDHEPEARLTAFCIEERISELPLLWKRHKLETLSNCYIISFLQEHSKKKQMNVNGSDSSVEVQEEEEKDNNSKCYSMNDKTSTNSNNHHEYSNNVCYINKFENSLHCKYNDHHHLLHPPQHKHYFHQISSLNNNNNNNLKKQHLNNNNNNNNNIIVEKNFNMNSNNKCNNNNQQQQQQQPQPKLTLPLQPYHARNPCMERNLMIEEDQEERAEILEQGLKFKIPNYNNTNEMNLDTLSNEIDQNDTMISTANTEMNYSENRSLIQAPNPIPFVQNYVHNNSGEAMIDVSSSTSSSLSIKIKDVNMYRNTNAKCRRFDNFLRLNIMNFLKRKFNLDLFNPNKESCYPKYDDYKTKSTNVDNNFSIMATNNDIVESKDSISPSSSMSINNKSTILNSPSTTMISSGDNNNYPFSIHENQIIIDDSKFDKLKNISSLSVGCVPYISNKLENNLSITTDCDNEYFITTSESSNNQPKMLQIVD